LKEAEKLGFTRAIGPSGAGKHGGEIKVDEIELLQDLALRFTSDMRTEV
jgi:hypothetical protein